MKRIAIILLCIAILVSGCQNPQVQTSQPGGPSAAETATKDLKVLENKIQTEIDNRSEIEIAADIDAARNSLQTLFPDVTFVKEKSKAVTLEWSGEEGLLSATDAAGLTWTLIIPAGALSHSQTITMTPLANIKDGQGGEKSGVLFEPDGLLFLVPAELTVTGPGVGKAILLSADRNGQEMQVAPSRSIEGGIKAPLFHFSTSFTDTGTFSEEKVATFKKEADKLYDRYGEKARELLKKKIKPPKPPEFKLNCFPGGQMDEFKAYVNEYIGEELKYATIMHIVWAAGVAGEDKERMQDTGSLLQQLAARGSKKIDMLLSFESLRPETYFMAFLALKPAFAFFGLEYIATASQGTDDRDMKSMKEFINNLQRSGDFTWKYLLDGIRNEHRYSLIEAALVAELMLGITDGFKPGSENGSRAQERRQELSNAVTFTVSFTGTTIEKGDKGVASWTTEGEGKAALQQYLGTEETLEQVVLNGSGQGKHTHYSSSDPAAVKQLITTDFQSEMVLTASLPCFSDIQAGVTRLGANELVYASDIGPIRVPSFYNLINQLAFGKYYVAEYKAVMVEVDMEDGSASASEEIDGHERNSTLTYTIKVEHSPQ